MLLTCVVFSADECDHYSWKNKLRTRMQYPPHSLANVFQDVIMWRPAVSVVPNFLKGCPMHNDYITSGFSKWKGTAKASLFNEGSLRIGCMGNTEATASQGAFKESEATFVFWLEQWSLNWNHCHGEKHP